MKFHIYVVTFLMVILLTSARKILKRRKRDVETCPSLVYCQGQLLDTVQTMRIYTDSKTFVDMSQINSEAETISNFNDLLERTNNNPTKENITKFLKANFKSELEMERWTPSDFIDEPRFLSTIGNKAIRRFAKKVVSFWPDLGRRVKDSVKKDPSRYSLIPVPQGFIVPGGRFREIYYWDSYWIINGLLISEMYNTVKGMLDNFIYLIKNYGFIPNGSRVYYLNRSQPPLFAMMVAIYMDYQNDLEWLAANIEHIETELLFWIKKRSVSLTKNGVTYELARYGPESNTPRPESYHEDLVTCSYFSTDAEKQTCYNALKTGAESGWDFSTRWFFDEVGNTHTSLLKINTKRVVPVDLNAILCKSFALLSKFYKTIGNTIKSEEWAQYADKWARNIEIFLYNAQDGIWYDYDITLKKQRNVFFASNFVPLWADAYNLSRKNEYGQRALNYFKRKNIQGFMGGVPTSLEESGEQWDLPNSWPPLQEFVILGFYKTGNEEAVKLAHLLSKRWIEANMAGFNRDGVLYEKYDAIIPGAYGGGGEYDVQIGFGWTNGLVLSLLKTFGGASVISKTLLNIFLYSSLFSFILSIFR